MRTRIKFCGITRPEDAQAAVRCGVDAVGLVFYPPSSRCLDFAGAQALARALGPFVCKVGLFVDPTESEVAEACERVPLDLLQFHGEEPAAFCEGFARPYLKALRMRPELNVDAAMAAYPGAAGFLLDAYQPGQPGGTGRTFEWSRVPALSARPIVLAGGLSSDNVAAALRQVRPYGVDVSGGVERAKGVKDATRMQAFADEVRAGDGYS